MEYELCKRVCLQKNNREEIKGNFPIAYALRNKNESVRESSSSGGVFYELAKHILESGGVVYGAVFNEDFQVVHMRGVNIDDVKKMQGSKYVQSDTQYIFESVKRDLSEGKIVLFTGCPCQVSGLKRYLRECDHKRLITCDLICHGVNSPKIWQDYLRCRVKKEHITEIHFRNKLLGWRNPVLSIHTNKKRYKESSEYDFFYQAFFNNYILRDSCYSCKYANLDREGDITIGDFWGVEHVCPELDDDKGISLLLINSVKGEMVLEQIKERFIMKRIALEDGLQPPLKSPSKCPEKYIEFWDDYLQYGFYFVCKKFLNGGIKGKIKMSIRKVLVRLNIWAFVMKVRRMRNEGY